MDSVNNDVTEKPRKKRRNSILKKYNHGSEEILDGDEDETTSVFSKSSRRVSFGRKSIKVFSECPQQTGTIWQNSFEEPLKLDSSNENVSKILNKNKGVPQRTTLFDENRSYGNMEMTQNVHDKDNTIYQYDPALDNTEVLCNINPNTIFMVNKENIAPPLSETIIFDKDMTCSNLDMTDLALSIDQEKSGGVVVAVKQFRNERRKTIHFDPNTSGNMNCTQVLTEDVFFETNISLHRYPGTDQHFPISCNSDKSSANIGMTGVLPDTIPDYTAPTDGPCTTNKSLESGSQFVPSRKTIYYNPDKSCADIEMTGVLPDTIPNYAAPTDGPCTTNKSLESGSQFVPSRKTIYYNPDKSCADIEMTGVLPDTIPNYVAPTDGPCTTNKSLESGSQFVPSRKTIYYNPDKSCADIEMTGVLPDTIPNYAAPTDGPCTTNKSLESGSQFVPSRKTIYYNPDKSCADIEMTGVLPDTIPNYAAPTDGPCTTNKSLESGSQFVPSRKTIYYNPDKSCADIEMTGVLPDTIPNYAAPTDGPCTTNKSLESGSQFVPSRKTIYYNPDKSCADIEMTGVLPDTIPNYVAPTDGPCTANKSLESGSQFVPSRKTIYYNPDKSCADIEMTGVLPDSIPDYAAPPDGPCTTNKSLESGSQFVPSRKTIYYNPDKSCADIEMTGVLPDTIPDYAAPPDGPCTTNKSLESGSQFVPSRKTIYYNPDKSCADIEMTGVLPDTIPDYAAPPDGPCTTNKSLESGSQFVPSRKTIYYNPDKSCADIEMTGVLPDTIPDYAAPPDGPCTTNKSLESGSQFVPSRKTIYYNPDKSCADIEMTGVLPDTIPDYVAPPDGPCTANKSLESGSQFVPSRKTIYYNPDKSCADIEMTGVLPDTIPDYVAPPDGPCTANKSLESGSQFVPSRKTIYYNPNKSCADIDMTDVLSDTMQDNVPPPTSSCSINKSLQSGSQILPSKNTIYFSSDKPCTDFEITGVLSITNQDKSILSSSDSYFGDKFSQQKPLFAPSRKTIYFNSDKSSANIEMTAVLSDTIQDNVSVDGSCSVSKSLQSGSQVLPTRKTIYFNSDNACADIEITGTLSEAIQDYVQSVDGACSTNKSLKNDPQFASSRKTIYFNSDKFSANIEMTGVLSDTIQDNVSVDGSCSVSKSLQSGSQVLPSRKTIYFNSDNACADIEITGALPITNQDKSIPSSSGSCFADGSSQQNPSFEPSKKTVYSNSDKSCANIQMKGVLPGAIQGKNMILLDDTRFTDKSLQLNESRKIPTMNEELLQDISFDFNACSPIHNSPNVASQTCKINGNNSFKLLNIEEVFVLATDKFEKTVNYRNNNYQKPINSTAKSPLGPAYSIESWNEITKRVRSMNCCTLPKVTSLPKTVIEYEQPVEETEKDLYIGAEYPITPSIKELIINKCNTMLIWKDNGFSNNSCCFTGFKQRIWHTNSEALIKLYVYLDGDINEADTRITDIKIESNFLKCKEYNELLQLSFIREMNYNMKHYYGSVENIFKLLDDTNLGLRKLIDFYTYLKKLVIEAQITINGTRLEFSINCDGWMEFQVDVSRHLRRAFKKEDVIVLEGNENIYLQQFLSLLDNVTDDDNFAYNYVKLCLKNVKVFVGMC